MKLNYCILTLQPRLMVKMRKSCLRPSQTTMFHIQKRYLEKLFHSAKGYVLYFAGSDNYISIE